MMTETNPTRGRATARLTPELLVHSLARSLAFWCDLCGFSVAYARPEEGFAYLHRDGAEVMLEEIGAAGRKWVTDTLEQPFGRGINLQIEVEDLTPILAAISDAGRPLFMAPEEKWYRTGSVLGGQRQFVVQDPDGYLLRFAQSLGERPFEET